MVAKRQATVAESGCGGQGYIGDRAGYVVNEKASSPMERQVVRRENKESGFESAVGIYP